MKIEIDSSSMEMVHIDLLKPYEKNSRTHSSEQIDQIAKSIQEFGFLNPLLVRDDYMVLAGHGRLEAAKFLGMLEIPVIFINHLTEDQARAYVIADNKIALNAGWDFGLLSEELASLELENFDISLTGFSDAELEKLFTDGGQIDDDEDEANEEQQETNEGKDRKFILGSYAFTITAEEYNSWFRHLGAVAGSYDKDAIISEIKTRLEL